MTDHTNTNPPGPLEAPSSPSPADAGGAVEVAVPPAGRRMRLTWGRRRALERLAACEQSASVAEVRERVSWAPYILCDATAHSALLWAAEHGFAILVEVNPKRFIITPAGCRLLKEGK